MGGTYCFAPHGGFLHETEALIHRKLLFEELSTSSDGQGQVIKRIPPTDLGEDR